MSKKFPNLVPSFRNFVNNFVYKIFDNSVFMNDIVSKICINFFIDNSVLKKWR